MKGLVLSTLALAALAGPAIAADMPAKAPVYKAPVAAPVYNWTGFYAGIAGGWANMKTDTSSGVVAIGSTPEYSDSGAVLGGTLGYNWQTGIWVLGVEGDLSWTNLSANSVGFCGAPGCTVDLQWLGTARGRAGYLITSNTLLYVTGGLAVASVHAHQDLVPVQNYSYTNTKAGWTIGAGVEAHVWGNWTAKIEYLHVDIGASGYQPTVVGAPQTIQTDYVRDDIVRLGLNYKFF